MSRYSSFFLVSFLAAGAVHADTHEGEAEAPKADAAAKTEAAPSEAVKIGDMELTKFAKNAIVTAKKACLRDKNNVTYQMPSCDLERIITKACAGETVRGIGTAAAWIVDPFTFDFFKQPIEHISATDDADEKADKIEEAASNRVKAWSIMNEELASLRSDSEELMLHRKKGLETREGSRSIRDYVEFSKTIRQAAGEGRVRSDEDMVAQKYFQKGPQLVVHEVGGRRSKSSLEINFATADKRGRVNYSDTVLLDRGEGYAKDTRVLKVSNIRLHFGDYAADICRAAE